MNPISKYYMVISLTDNVVPGSSLKPEYLLLVGSATENLMSIHIVEG